MVVGGIVTGNPALALAGASVTGTAAIANAKNAGAI